MAAGCSGITFPNSSSTGLVIPLRRVTNITIKFYPQTTRSEFSTTLVFVHTPNNFLYFLESNAHRQRTPNRVPGLTSVSQTAGLYSAMV